MIILFQITLYMYLEFPTLISLYSKRLFNYIYYNLLYSLPDLWRRICDISHLISRKFCQERKGIQELLWKREINYFFVFYLVALFPKLDFSKRNECIYTLWPLAYHSGQSRKRKKWNTRNGSGREFLFINTEALENDTCQNWTLD